jgi:hypothetical protein
MAGGSSAAAVTCCAQLVGKRLGSGHRSAERRSGRRKCTIAHGHDGMA